MIEIWLIWIVTVVARAYTQYTNFFSLLIPSPIGNLLPLELNGSFFNPELTLNIKLAFNEHMQIGIEFKTK